MLLSVYSCKPGKEPDDRIGWNWVGELSRFHDVWVVTRAGNRPAIERALATEPLASAHFVYYDLPGWLPKRLHHFLWQIGACFLTRTIHGQVDFETVHQVTPAGYRVPGFLPLLPVRFIWARPLTGTPAPVTEPAPSPCTQIPAEAVK
jgi:hypothetical protein